MNKLDIKVGDLVKLRDDLKVDRIYGTYIFVENMKFKDFKKVIELTEDKAFKIEEKKDSELNEYYFYTKCMIAEVKRPCKYKTIYKREEPILDDKEKEYLSAVIKPYKVSGIKKRQVDNEEHIYIYVIGKYYTDVIILPYFKKGTMYKGMKLNKEYTLEELGL